MKALQYFSMISLALLVMLVTGGPAFAQTASKGLQVGSATVTNTGDDRTVTLDLKATNFDNVNGVVFTLNYDKEVFEYIGLVRSDKSIDKTDYSATDVDGNPIYEQPEASTIAETIYYQDNASSPGRVLIAAAGANYFAPSADEYVPFRVKLRVKEGRGSGIYPVKLQKTIIGPDTAANAGYSENTVLPVAAGLAPDAGPETAQNFDVALNSGTITVSGGYKISGSVSYEGGADADGAKVNLMKQVDSSWVFADSDTVDSGSYSFSGKPAGTYKVKVKSDKPGFQRLAESSDLAVTGDTPDVNILLSAYDPLTGKVTLNGENISGLKVKVVRKSDSEVIGYFNVDENGNFVTSSLPGDSSDYDIYAAYGGTVSDTAMTYGDTFNYQLTLTNLDVTINGMDGKDYMVHVIQSDGKLERSVSGTASSDSKTVTVANLISGKEYRVSVAGDGIPVTFYDADVDPTQTTVFSESDLLTVNESTTDTATFDFSEKDVNTISGTVTKDNSGIAVDIYAVSTDYSNVYGTSSDADNSGQYSVDVAPGEYMVYGLYNDTAFYYMTGDTSTKLFSEKSLVDANAGNVGNVNVIIDVDETNAWFYGKVTEKRNDGNPVPSALIVAENSDRIVVSETDEQGKYKLEGFKNAETATISMPAFPGTKEPADASNDGTEVNLVVNEGYTVSGTVTDSNDDSRITGATVYLKDTNGKISGLPVKSDSNGEFKLTDVASGIYTLIGVHPDYKKYAEDDFDVQEDISGLSVAMDPGAWIEGKVTTDGTNPIEDAVIVALAPGKSYVATTDQDGDYKIAGLEDNKAYDLFAEKQGYAPMHKPAVKAYAHDDDSHNFTMSEVSTTTYEVTGTITGLNLKDGAVAEVILYSTAMNAFMKTTTGNGEYSFSKVMEADDYVLVIRRDGKPTVKKDIGTVDGNNTTHNVNIDSNTISGKVLLSDNQTGKTVKVFLVNESEDVLQTLEVTEDDSDDYSYTFQDVITGGTYKIAAFCEGYDMQWYNGTDFSSAETVTPGKTGAEITLETN